MCPGFVVLLMLCAESVRWNWVHSAFLVRVVVVFSGRRGGGGSAAACGGTHFTEVCVCDSSARSVSRQRRRRRIYSVYESK